MTKLLSVAREMPALPHHPNADSEVLRWIASQPDLQRWLFETLRQRRIIQATGNGLWSGVHLLAPDPPRPSPLRRGRPPLVTEAMVQRFVETEAGNFDTRGATYRAAAEKWGVCQSTAMRYLQPQLKARTAHPLNENLP